MDVEKQPEDRMRDTDGKSLEELHRNWFDHPSEEKWNATRSLAQPSFLKQIHSKGAAHSRPMKASPAVPKD